MLNIFKKKSSQEANATNKNEEQSQKAVVSETEFAAIAMALSLFYAKVHDEESDVITFTKSSNNYSPWNSKIYGMQ